MHWSKRESEWSKMELRILILGRDCTYLEHAFHTPEAIVFIRGWGSPYKWWGVLYYYPFFGTLAQWSGSVGETGEGTGGSGVWNWGVPAKCLPAPLGGAYSCRPSVDKGSPAGDSAPLRITPAPPFPGELRQAAGSGVLCYYKRQEEDPRNGDVSSIVAMEG